MTTIFESTIGNLVKSAIENKHKEDNLTDLMKAAKINDVEKIKTFIPTEAKQQDSFGLTALMYAVKYGQIPAAKLLIPHEIKMRDYNGWPALFHAIAYGYTCHADLLINEEYDIKSNDGMTTLMISMRYNVPNYIEKCLPTQAGIPTQAKLQDNSGMSALMYAILNRKDQTESVKLLIPHEFKLQDTHGLSALMYAVKESRLDYVKLLTIQESGLIDNHGNTALMLAVLTDTTEDKEIVQHLIPFEARKQNFNGESALMRAVSQPTIVKLLVDKESLLTDMKGKTALMYAVENNNKESVEILAPNECNITDMKGYNALMYALEKRPNLCKILCKYENVIPECINMDNIMFNLFAYKNFNKIIFKVNSADHFLNRIVHQDNVNIIVKILYNMETSRLEKYITCTNQDTNTLVSMLKEDFSEYSSEFDAIVEDIGADRDVNSLVCLKCNTYYTTIEELKNGYTEKRYVKACLCESTPRLLIRLDKYDVDIIDEVKDLLKKV